tara:strand:- start:858 stop:998 length:141 start_codon:yes stop_codon:yes gene_type:complete
MFSLYLLVQYKHLTEKFILFSFSSVSVVVVEKEKETKSKKHDQCQS